MHALDDSIFQRRPGLEAEYVFRGGCDAAGQGLAREPGNMWHDDDVVEGEEWVVDANRLGDKDIQPGTGQASFFQGNNQRRFIDQATAGSPANKKINLG